MRISDWSSDVCSSDLPGPACYDRGGLKPNVTDADLVLGYLDPKNYANGRIPLNPKRARQAIEDQLCDELDMGVVQAAQLIKRNVDSSMANGIATELDRKSVVEGKSVSVRVDLGGRRIIKKKNKYNRIQISTIHQQTQ